METRKAICQGCYSGPVGHTHTPQHTPRPEQGWVHESDGSPATAEELQAVWEDQNIKDDAPDRTLLSAAPDLLEALKVCMGKYARLSMKTGESFDLISELKAIAKAEGR